MAMKLFKKPAVLHYFKTGLKKNYVFFIIGLVLHLISFPLTLGIFTIEESSNAYGVYLSDMFAVLSFIFTGIALASGIVIAIHNFSYLHKKHESDTYMSFPLSDKQRFFCDYFSGLLCYIVPMAIAGIACVLVSFVTMATVEDYQYYLLGTNAFSLAGIVAKAYFLAIICMTMFYTLTVLACTLCGSLFETAINALLINGIIPGMIALLTFITFNQVDGISISHIMLPLLSKTSPVGAVISFFVDASTIEYDVFELLYIFKFSLWLIIFTAGYTALSFILYKKRKAESVSKPYVFKAFYYIVISCITLAICAVIPLDSEMLIFPMILVATVVYLIFEAITKRGLKNFKYSVLRCVVTIAVSLFVIAFLNTPWGFGAGKRVPEVSSVKSVTIDYLGVVRDGAYSDGSITFKDEKAIEIIVKLHEDIVERTDFYNDYDGLFDYYDYYDVYSSNPYTITYKLKNGSTFTRTYNLSHDDIYVLTQLEVLEEYPQQISEVFKREHIEWGGISFTTAYGEAYGIYSSDDESTIDGISYISKKEFEKLIDELSKAIEADLSERTLEEIRNPKTPYGLFSVGGTNLYVFENDERILSVLKKYNLYELTPSEYFASNRKYAFIDNVNLFKTQSQPEYAEFGWIPQNELSYYSFYHYELTDEFYDLQEKLLLNMIPYTFEEGEFYYVELTGFSSSWYIPHDYADEAQALYDLAEKYYKKSYHEYYDIVNEGDYEKEPSENDETDEDVVDDVEDDFNDAA